MLDNATLEAVYASKSSKRKPKASKGKVLLKGADSFVSITKMGDFDFGAFEGKVGTMRRSRKGQSRRMPNGSRRYNALQTCTNEVVAYKLKSK